MTWTVDPMHTQVEFSAKHMGIMTVKGAFTGLTTDINFNEDDFTASSVEATVDASTLSTHDNQRDGHLKSPDFLDVEHFPTITFKSTRIEPVGDDEYKMTGDLTIKGITRPVALKVKRYGEINDERMGHRVAYSAEGEINRKDFGLTMNMLVDGRWMVGDEVKIAIELELVEQKQEAAAAATA